MASRTIARLYDTRDAAHQVVRDLEAAGFAHDDISLVARQGDDDAVTDRGDTTGSGAGTGASIGTVLGGGAGLLAGLGMLAIPGLGPVVAAGWLIAAVTGAGVGAAAGGLLGSLTAAGVSEEHAHVYTEGVRRGGTLVTLRTDDARATDAERIMAQHSPVDPDARGTEYRSGGWSGYEPTPDTLTDARQAGTSTDPRADAVPPGTTRPTVL